MSDKVVMMWDEWRYRSGNTWECYDTRVRLAAEYKAYREAKEKTDEDQ